MVIVLELAGLAALLLGVWVMFRAARARPDERGLRYAAWGALVTWVVFAVATLVDFGYIRENTGLIGQNIAIGVVVLAVVFGYRMILTRLRDNARDN